MMLASCSEPTSKNEDIQLVSITPNEAKIGATVTLNGYYFSESMLACFGENNCVSVNYESASQVTAKVPEGSGTVDVIVEDGVMKSVLKNGFKYIPGGQPGVASDKPAVNKVDPVSGFAGEDVTLTGENLSKVSKVCFGTSCVAPASAENNKVVAKVPEGKSVVPVIFYVGDQMYTTGKTFEYLKTSQEPNDIDWCALINTNVVVAPNEEAVFYGQVYEEGCTPDAANKCANFKAQYGYISADKDISDMSAYTWQDAEHNTQYSGSPNNDEYMGRLKLPAGDYRVAFRFSRNDKWLYCDLDGANPTDNGFRSDYTGTLKVADKTVEWCQILGLPENNTIASNINEDSETVYAQFFVSDCTNKSNHCPDLKVQIGYGSPAYADVASINQLYNWKDAAVNPTPGDSVFEKHDEYMAVLNSDRPGTYSVLYRGSMDGGKTWTYCTTDDSVTFDAAKAPKWVVTDPSTIEQPPKTIEWCKLQSPAAIKAEGGSSSPLIYGQVYVPDCTTQPDDCKDLLGQVGYGAPGKDVKDFTYVDATRNAAAQNTGNNHEYQGMFTNLPEGDYKYVYRFSVDNKATWKYCDLKGGEEFSKDDIGDMMVGVTWCQLRNGKLADINLGQASEPVYAHVFLNDCTGKDTACDKLKAQVGYGSKDETDASKFKWSDAEFYAESTSAAPGIMSSNSEYVGTITPEATGEFAVAYRFSTDNGKNWTYCDTDESTNIYNKEKAGSIKVEKSAGVTWCQVRNETAGNISLGQTSEAVYSHVYVKNCTSKTKECPGLIAEIGYGTKGETNLNKFTWSEASFYSESTTVANDRSEYVGKVTPGAIGDYDIAYRFSTDSGRNWIYCDTDESTTEYNKDKATSLTVEESAGVTWCQVRNADAGTTRYTLETNPVYSHVYVKNCTSKNKACPGLKAQIGYGNPNETDPSVFIWHDADFYPESTTAEDNNSEYVGKFKAGVRGDFAVAFRFSYNDSDWVYCDTDETLGYDKSKATKLKVVDYWQSGSEFSCGIEKGFADTATGKSTEPFTFKGQVYVKGCTENKVCDKVANTSFHYGPYGSDMSIDAWSFASATINSKYEGNNNEYMIPVTLASGEYSYVFSVDMKIPDSTEVERHYCYYDWGHTPAKLTIR